nr:glycosyltransferase family A protein [Candidatus Baldrarchaeota archaeon]
MYEVSVVIRTRDIEDKLFKLLSMLAAQTIKPKQIVIVDNYSCERSLRDMKSFLLKAKKKLFKSETAIRLVALPDELFSHAYSTNLGVYFADNEFVCITNGHSLPISRRWLENGLIHFENPKIAGVSGYFLPLSNASLWEKLQH